MRLSPEDCLVGGGDMGALMRSTDWSRTALGPVAEWPQSLRTAISIMLESRFAMVVAWGPSFRFFYNDRYRPILGTKHPAALGAPGAEIIPEVWSVVGPEFERVRAGESFAIDDWLVPLDRNGYLENCWFTLSYSPIRDETGGVGGLLAVVVETTGRVEGERRLATLLELARRAADANTPNEACINATEVFAGNAIDVPFALIYLLDREGTVAERVCGVRIAASPEVVDLISGSNDVFGLSEVVSTGRTVIRSDLKQRVGDLPGGPYPEPAHTAVLLPLSRPLLEHPYGVLVAGVSPRRALDDRYRGFFELAADHIATAISNAVTLEETRHQADALAEIDRAKTAFFSNVSHEFRTPLTLMLGPSADLLADVHGPLSQTQRAQVDILQRNARRLLKLVNGLLDFSRIEAGRAQASYIQTDLAKLTRELAGAFRSPIEHAGLGFEVHCEPIDNPVYVDRDMWEKIVLNLLSNALKFTFEGTIRLELRQRDHQVELTVRDTGVGIPATELPRVFERFHRVEGTRARTHEGSGIGLALTDELVRLHGGTIAATSRVDEGSRFVVQIPTGRAHLPEDRIDSVPASASTAVGTAPFVDEAIRWLPEPPAKPGAPVPPSAGPSGARERILVVDDNADMRDYLRQLLLDWEVDTATDGKSALDAARAAPPDLVVTDVMMPGLDGFALLQELRRDERTKAVPVLMVSARAGEEARVSGLGAGADDYVSKPFTARELTARVRSLLALTRARREAELQKQHLRSVFMQAPTPMLILNGPTYVIELANPWTCRVWGRNEKDVLGKPMFEAIPELAAQPFRQLLDDVLRTGVAYVGKETPARLDRRGDGTLETLFFNLVYAPLRGVYGTVEGILAIAFDVTDEVTARDEMGRLRAAAEAANRTKDEFLAILETEVAQRTAELQRSEAYLALAQRLTHTGSWAGNITTREFLHSSEEHSRLHGFDPDQGTPTYQQLYERVHPEDRDRIVEAFDGAARTMTDIDVQFRIVLPDGTTRYVQAVGHPAVKPSGFSGEFAGILMDVTERRRADAERETLRQAQADLAHVARVTTMGELTASLAHEINQPITGAITNAVAALGWMGAHPPNLEEVRQALARIVKDGNRASEVIGRIRALVEKAPPRKDSLEINEAILEVIALTRGEVVKHRVSLQSELAVGLPPIQGDRVQLQQVILNLIINAVEAMSGVEGGPRQLRISTGMAEPDVLVAVQDSGPGLDPAGLERLFEAFYTTKPTGLGMGLSICRSIIMAHEGRLWATAGVPRGAIFQFTLPAHPGGHSG